MSNQNAIQVQPATAPEAQPKPEATTSQQPGGIERETTQPTAEAVAEAVYQLLMEDLRLARQRLYGW